MAADQLRYHAVNTTRFHSNVLLPVYVILPVYLQFILPVYVLLQVYVLLPPSKNSFSIIRRLRPI
jgi:hypothetical protein